MSYIMTTWKSCHDAKTKSSALLASLHVYSQSLAKMFSCLVCKKPVEFSNVAYEYENSCKLTSEIEKLNSHIS
jgi:hypothetical protein